MNLLPIASPPKKNVNGSNSCHTKRIYYKQNNSFAHILLLTTVSHYKSQQSNYQYYWPDLTAIIAKKCLSIGKLLQDILQEEAFEDSQQFNIFLLDLTRIALSHGLSLFQEPEQEEMEPLARRYCSRYNDKYIEWLPEAGMSILTDDCQGKLKSN